MKLFTESINAIAGWSWFLEPAVWKDFVVLTLVFAAMTLWRRSTAAARHLAWTMTFVCLLCLPVFVKCLPAWQAPTWIVPSVLNNGLPDSLSIILQNKKQPKSRLSPTAAESAVSAHNSTDVSRQTTPVKNVVKWNDLVVAIWFAGIIIGLARLLVVQIRLERMAGRMRTCENSEWLKSVDDLRIKYRIRRRVKLLISETSASPMTWGFWQPIIALPAEALQWSDEKMRVVLRHELAHVKRWDCLTQEIAHLVCVLYWFNPLAWLAAGRMRAEREKACDDFVLNAGARPSEYAGHLVEIARQFSSANLQGAVAMARPSGLEQRVAAILDARRQRKAVGKVTTALIVLLVFGLGILLGGCVTSAASKPTALKPATTARMAKFAAEKEVQESQLIKTDEADFAKSYDNGRAKMVVPDCRPFFAAAARGDWPAVSNLWSDLENHTLGSSKSTNGYPHGMWLQPVRETFGAVEQFTAGSEKYATDFGDDIIQSIPPGSIYFGGTDPGRFIVTMMEKSHVNGDPFFTLTQNALADGTYLEYLRSMYGEEIYIPTKADSQKCFEDYVADIQKRSAAHELKPGEHIKEDQGRVQISGQVAVMQINGLLVKTIFDQNTNRDFYVEESWPLDWMYPYLEPHGLIMKINRQPLSELSDEIVQRDHDYWTKTIQPMIGDWLNEDTSVQEITDFAKKVFLQHDFNGFTGDPQFVQNEYSCKMFSKERDSIADLYVWRMNHAATFDEKERMALEADFAFRQALALCPYNSEAAKGYASFLKSRHRDSDAALVTEMAKQFPKMK